jgi:hypothetical protein
MPFQTSKLQEILTSRVLRKHGLFFLLLLLPLASFVSVHIGLLTALVFTFFVPGLIFYRFFRLKIHEILVFVPIFSVLISTGILLIFSSWLFKGNYPRFVSCFGCRLRAGKFAKRGAVLLQRLPQNHSSQQSTAANFSSDFQYLVDRTLPERLV